MVFIIVIAGRTQHERGAIFDDLQPSGKKSIEHVIQQLAVELKADTIRLLERASNLLFTNGNDRAQS